MRSDDDVFPPGNAPFPMSPATRLDVATQLRQQKIIGRYAFRKLIDGPMAFKLAMKLITADFREALRSAVRREMRRRRHA